MWTKLKRLNTYAILLLIHSFFDVHNLTVACSVTWPLNGSEAGGDPVLIQISLLLLCKSICSDGN